MKRDKWVLFALLAILASCQRGIRTETVPPSESIAAAKTSDSILKTFVANKKGDTLYMEYDNAKDSALFRYQGELISLKQNPSGSGIRYSNTKFEYTEWHGESTLRKNGKIIFTNP